MSVSKRRRPWVTYSGGSKAVVHRDHAVTYCRDYYGEQHIGVTHTFTDDLQVASIKTYPENTLGDKALSRMTSAILSTRREMKRIDDEPRKRIVRVRGLPTLLIYLPSCYTNVLVEAYRWCDGWRPVGCQFKDGGGFGMNIGSDELDKLLKKFKNGAQNRSGLEVA